MITALAMTLRRGRSEANFVRLHPLDDHSDRKWTLGVTNGNVF
jgi:hypothetical protein